MAFCPRVQTAVDEGRGDDVGPVCQGRAEVIETAAAKDGAHALTHQFLLRIGGAEVVKLLAPLIDLVAQVYLDWADRLTAQTQGAGTHVARMLLGVAQHAEVDADGAGDEVTVRIAA